MTDPLADAIARVLDKLPANPTAWEIAEGLRGELVPVAHRYVHHDYAGRRVSRYGNHAVRVNGHDHIEVHPLYSLTPETNDG